MDKCAGRAVTPGSGSWPKIAVMVATHCETMTLKDYRDLEISGATGAARDAFERALDAHLSWRSGADLHLQEAVREAPAFTMAYVLRCYFDLCNRDWARVQLARSAFTVASGLPATPRERLHLAAIAAALADDFETFGTLLQRLLEQNPHDLLALQVGHAFDYLTGDSEGMAARINAVLPAWSKHTPGYHSVLAMQAFSLVEAGQYGSAADRALRALEINPWDARAHHAMTHVHEMSGNAAGGMRWMRERHRFWASDTVAVTHLWWHWALFHLALGEVRAALAVYDEYVRGKRSTDIPDLIDAAALLWRIELAHGNTGRRWSELASAWAGRSEDGYCTFSDVHAMLAQVGAEDWQGAKRLENALLRSHRQPTRYGETTRLIGLPACRAIVAFGQGDYPRALQLFGKLPAYAHRIGGSHAQRDLLQLTALEGARRLRGLPRSVAA